MFVTKRKIAVVVAFLLIGVSGGTMIVHYQALSAGPLRELQGAYEKRLLPMVADSLKNLKQENDTLKQEFEKLRERNAALEKKQGQRQQEGPLKKTPEGVGHADAVAEPKTLKADLTFGVKKSALPVLAFVPPGDAPKKGFPLVVAFPPGFGRAADVQSASAAYWAPLAKEAGYIVVMPQVNGLTVRADPSPILTSLFEWIGANARYDKERVVFAGPSLGGIAALHAAAAAPDRAAGVFAFPGGFGGDWKQFDRLKGKRVLLLTGENDPTFRLAAQRVVDNAAKSGPFVIHEVLAGQGHELKLSAKQLSGYLSRAMTPDRSK